MQRALALAGLLGVAAAGTVSVKVTDGCGSSCKTSGVTINAPSTAPNPGSFSFDGSGTLGVAVDSSATMNLALKLGGVAVLNKDVTACGEQSISLPVGLGSVALHGPTCPLAAGAAIKLGATVSSNAKLPAEVTGVATYKQGADTLVIIDIDITPAKALAATPACNATDTQIWNATGFQSFQDDMTACGKQCLGKDTCVSQCVAGKEHYSAPCSACFGALGQCTASSCLTKCMGGRTAACTQCVKAAGCDSAFAACSGWQPPQ
eukprot:TRINITY_DN896_c0_g1_i2.p2 TRINITY_DN896_c0_g1~~TRINITY_DN896_c0_g1_i2.p2  ORF type:complete len:285 (+),score=104.98 TRINITY_DN896_c0_g1_i2:69-857(+)